MRHIERHGTGARWFYKNQIWIAPVVGFGIATAISNAVIYWS
jgi:hypothetical protein